jgi:hypothetical protein
MKLNWRRLFLLAKKNEAAVAPINLKLLYRCAAIFCLLGGTAIYIFFRNVDNLVLFHFFSKPGFLYGLPVSVHTGNVFVSVFVFQGPSILWLLSGLFIIRSIWLANKKWMQIYVISFAIITVVNELCQLLPYIPGVFDIRDLFALCITAFLESVTFNYLIGNRRKK